MFRCAWSNLKIRLYFWRGIFYVILPFVFYNWQTQVEWEYHLVAVACLSLAAKMEEIEVPYFMDLQLVDPTFVFESKTIQRMELCVMDRLKWRLHSITPFDYLHYFISKLSFAPNLKLKSMTQLFSSASNLILNTTLGNGHSLLFFSFFFVVQYFNSVLIKWNTLKCLKNFKNLR